MTNILLIGSNGNLGSEIKKCFESTGYNVFVTSRNTNAVEAIFFDGSQQIELPKNLKIDLVINAANEYHFHPKFEEIKSMNKAILGVAQKIFLSDISCPLVFFSSYLQYLPTDLQPWSDYTEIKSKASEFFKEYGKDRNVTTLELTLYDNYGGKRKDKFFDLVLDSINNKKVFKATNGHTVVNLTHVSDIVKNLKSFIENNVLASDKKIDFSYSIRSGETFSLRNLVNYIEEVSNKRVLIEWGSLSYRTKEIFQFYDTKPVLPGFSQVQSVRSYIQSALR